MNLNDYFNPIEVGITERGFIHPTAQIISYVKVHTKKNPIESTFNYDIAFLGVPDESASSGLQDPFLNIRTEIYSLCANRKTRLFDLGNLKSGKAKNDTIIGLRDVIIDLITNNLTPIIVGNSEDVLFAQYLANVKLGIFTNIAIVDSKIAINENKESNIPSVLWKILVNENESVSTFTNIGFQTYFVNPKTLQFITKNNFSAYRLGYMRSNLKESEPVLRDAHLIGIDISSVRLSDAPAQTEGSPNGFYGEEICQIARYSGTSNKVSTLGVYNYNYQLDQNKQTSKLIAQLIWYFFEGYYQRIDEDPAKSKTHFKKFIVTIDGAQNELIFFKSEKTDRWWMEIPALKDPNQPKIISCTYEDYQKATSGELPDRWLNAFQKMNSE
jgi:arginase family enzyme